MARRRALAVPRRRERATKAPRPLGARRARPSAPTCSARLNSAMSAAAGSGAPYAFSRLSHATQTLNFSPSSR
jgi:hypothetical protein